MRRQATVCQSISSRILMLKLSGSVMPSPPSIPNGVDGSADSERFLNELLSATPGAQLRRLKASSPPRAQILSQRTRVIRHVIEFPDHFGIVEIAHDVTDQKTLFPHGNRAFSFTSTPGVLLAFRTGAG
jgi:hypothetical protein